jgi:hypothetical protein
MIDEEDISGRTALHVAALKNNRESVKMLLVDMADPFKKTHQNKLAIDLTTDNIIKFYLDRARLVIILFIYIYIYLYI